MIHETAIIDPSAKLAPDVKVGPWTMIGPEVEIGEGTEIASHVVLKGPTRIGKRNKIYQFASVGEEPQVKKYANEPTRLEIGDDNIIRENATIHRGTTQGNSVTRIGNRNYIMAYVHIAHDCTIGNDIIFANNVALSGHVNVDDFANLGGYAVVHQFCNIGSYSFVAAVAGVGKDVPPYVLVSGQPASVYGLNLVGLKRNGFSEETISRLRKAYNVIYRQGLTVPQAMTELEKMLSDCAEVERLISALNNATRGIVR